MGVVLKSKRTGLEKGGNTGKIFYPGRPLTKKGQRPSENGEGGRKIVKQYEERNLLGGGWVKKSRKKTVFIEKPKTKKTTKTKKR